MAFWLWFATWLGALGNPRIPGMDVVRLVEMRYQSARTLETVFQEQYFEGGKRVRAESGKAYFRRPGRMRWEYESPEVELFVVDGKNVWFYVPADRTAFHSSVKESYDWRTPFSLLVRNPRLSNFCKTVAAGPPDEVTEAGHAVLHCVPKGSDVGSKDEIVLEVNASTGDLSRVLVRESGGVEIEFQFGEWVRNPEIAERQFKFHPPPGVAIVPAEPSH